jgi:hypothetical protein
VGIVFPGVKKAKKNELALKAARAPGGPEMKNPEE